MSTEPELGSLLEEQRAYYQALARDYLSQGLDLPGGGELAEALEGFQPAGSVLELACGPGVWTSALLRHATGVTAVDASTEMLAIAAARITSSRVRFIQADLFAWRPDRRYDAVFMGFWISHVPAERFASFWSLQRLNCRGLRRAGTSGRNFASLLVLASLFVAFMPVLPEFNDKK